MPRAAYLLLLLPVVTAAAPGRRRLGDALLALAHVSRRPGFSRAVLEDVASVARARPSAVDSTLLAAIRDALKTFHPAALAAFDGTAAAPAARSSSFGGRRISLGGPSPE